MSSPYHARTRNTLANSLPLRGREKPCVNTKQLRPVLLRCIQLDDTEDTSGGT
jgi:hypothetical protein